MKNFQGIILKPNSKLDGFVRVDKGDVAKATQVMLPGTVNTHCHIFQPPGIPGELITEKNHQFTGWLPETLKFETKVKNNPRLAEKIARAKFKSHLENGILASLQYTTSSREACEIVLNVAAKMGVNIKIGYVCMNQGVDFIKGVKLETTDEEALRDTEYLLKKYGNKIVVIDRFPIAVSSSLRRKLAELARKYDVLYETHADESPGEAEIHHKIYQKSIIRTLDEDGIFKKGGKIGLAHCIHTSEKDFQILAKRIKQGCQIFVRACPNSNAQLQSHRLKNGNYVPFPFHKWQKIGALITFGLDKGAGRGLNLFSEALQERGRLHDSPSASSKSSVAGSPTPSYLDLLKIATLNGWKSLGYTPNYIIVKIPSLKTFYENPPRDLETLAALIIESGQDPKNIQTPVF